MHLWALGGDEAESVCSFSLGGKLQSPNTFSGTHEMLFKFLLKSACNLSILRTRKYYHRLTQMEETVDEGRGVWCPQKPSYRLEKEATTPHSFNACQPTSSDWIRGLLASADTGERIRSVQREGRSGRWLSPSSACLGRAGTQI
jgi:hypothetical protein